VTDNSDLIIIKKVLAGNRNAYALLVDRYKDMAVGLAYNILLNREDAEEIAQDAFVKAYGSLYTYRATAKFSTWLYRIVVNCALNKKKLKKYAVVNLDTTTQNILEEEAGDGLQSMMQQASKEHIQAALQTISDNERICISLYYLSELSVEEIHAVTGIMASNIKVLLYRGRKSLYASLKQRLKQEIRDLI
jgi:RNA polymerase sigma factor (sigma-70 family)